MSKQRFFESHASQLHFEIAKIVLKRENYKCSKCSARHKTEVVRYSDHYSEPIDAHEKEFLINSGVKPIKLFLRVLQTKGLPGSFDTEDFNTFCPMHAQVELKEKIQEIKKKKLGDLSNFRIQHIQEVKNFVFQVTGKMMLTKDCVGLIMRLEQVLNHK